jgi:hypothetical protein
LTILCSFLFSACTPEPKGFEPDPGNADFNQVIALGGSLMSGYQDGGLFLKAQEVGQRFKILSGLASFWRRNWS